MNEQIELSETTPQQTWQQSADSSSSSPWIDAALVLAGRFRLLVALPILVGVVTLGFSFLIPPVFTASTQLLPPQQQSSAASALLGSLGGVAGALGGSLGGLKSPTDQWIGLLKSRVVGDAIVDRFKLRELYEVDYQFQARDRLAANTVITSGKDGLIDVKVDDRKPERAAQIAAAYVEELQRLTSTLAVTEAAQRRLFFQKQLAEAKDGLTRAELALKEGGVGGDILKTSPTAAVAQLAQAQAAIAAQEIRVSVMRGTMTESNPELRQAQLQLSSLRDQLRRLEVDTPNRSDGQASRYIARYRDFKYYEALFDLFSRQYEAARLDEARDGALIQVVDPAITPEYKSKPKRAFMAVLATVFTLTATVLWALAMDRLQRFRNSAVGARYTAALRRAFRSDH